jgi:nitroreductase
MTAGFQIDLCFIGSAPIILKSMSAPVSSNRLQKPAVSDAELIPEIRDRWSPRAFSEQPVPDQAIRTILEAARWAASSMNEQPWRFIVARKEDADNYAQTLSVLVEFNQLWAKSAPVLLIAVAKNEYSSSGSPNRHAFHDLGMSLANLAIEATAQGLHVHFMGGFDHQKAKDVLGIPDGFEAVTAAAIGYLGNPETLSEKLRERELAPRARKLLSEIAFSAGNWGLPAFPDPAETE